MVKQVVEYGLSFIGVPYKWGGSNPISGFDCSGLIQEILMGFGMDIPGDQTAQAYYDHFKKIGKSGVIGPGALVFYGKGPKEITHITMMINFEHCLGANGGGSKTVDKTAADKADAFVKIRPLKYRNDLVEIIMPEYPA